MHYRRGILVDAFSHNGSDGHAALFLALEREAACFDHADQDASKLAFVVIRTGKVDRKSGGEANVVGQHLFDLVTISRQDASGRGADGWLLNCFQEKVEDPVRGVGLLSCRRR